MGEGVVSRHSQRGLFIMQAAVADHDMASSAAEVSDGNIAIRDYFLCAATYCLTGMSSRRLIVVNVPEALRPTIMQSETRNKSGGSPSRC